ncbi:hypothetical protein [Chryseoglobus sp. 28M-23]|uniref:hypothetical protein n=1 Tax=Chryseoglobus sp. 28M-23 TaxID=2772253 RepID=UPI001746511C|nr:hypothetical protein [Chryseoglobus sp. 28M-23]QOD92864.1 hypothetical protein IE160_07830 [Chryseoglobus sp. 28M-23]
MRDEFFSLSPPAEIIGGSLALPLSLFLAVAELTGRREPVLVVVAILMLVVSIVYLVRGLIRFHWWWQARRIALRWCAENNHVMPHDLRW